MNKLIIILDGKVTEKIRFSSIIREEGYQTWDIHPLKVLAKAPHMLGWDNNKEDINKLDKYYKFIEDLHKLVDSYFNFTTNYILDKIDRFKNSHRAQVLIIHSCKEPMRRQLQEQENNCYGIQLIDSNLGEYKDLGYSEMIDFTKEDFDNKVKEFVKSKSLENKEDKKEE